MSSNLLTILVGAIGVLAAVLCTYIAYKVGARRAAEQKAELVCETNRQKSELVREFQDVSSVFSTLVAAIEAGESPGGGEPAPARRAELVVRASLGTLLDERGEVRLQRLFDVVANAAGTPSRAETIRVLQRLRDHGLVDWHGAGDLRDADVVRVCLPGVDRPHRTSTALSGAVTA
jgi:hypothetical protein